MNIEHPATAGYPQLLFGYKDVSVQQKKPLETGKTLKKAVNLPAKAPPNLMVWRD